MADKFISGVFTSVNEEGKQVPFFPKSKAELIFNSNGDNIGDLTDDGKFTYNTYEDYLSDYNNGLIPEGKVCYIMEDSDGLDNRVIRIRAFGTTDTKKYLKICKIEKAVNNKSIVLKGKIGGQTSDNMSYILTNISKTNSNGDITAITTVWGEDDYLDCMDIIVSSDDTDIYVYIELNGTYAYDLEFTPEFLGLSTLSRVYQDSMVGEIKWKLSTSEYVRFDKNGNIYAKNLTDTMSATIANMEEQIEEVEAITKGKENAHVFDTKVEMDTYLSNPSNTSTLLVGDNLYIRETDVPDYWWDGTKACELETGKVDLSAIDTKAPINHATSETTYGVGNITNYGHVKLTDSYQDNTSGAAASATALSTVYNKLTENISTVSQEISTLSSNFQAGCSKIAGAITNQGVSTASNASPSTMADNIATLGSNKYNAGYNDGHSAGYTSGNSAGYTSGQSVGYTSGYNAGVVDGGKDKYRVWTDELSDHGYECGFTIRFEIDTNVVTNYESLTRNNIGVFIDSLVAQVGDGDAYFDLCKVEYEDGDKYVDVVVNSDIVTEVTYYSVRLIVIY